MSQATKQNTYNNANNNVAYIGCSVVWCVYDFFRGTEQPKQETRCDNGVSGNEGSCGSGGGGGGRW